MAETDSTQTFAETMKNPLAKKGMESIAACYEGFARRAKELAREGGAALRDVATDRCVSLRERTEICDPQPDRLAVPRDLSQW